MTPTLINNVAYSWSMIQLQTSFAAESESLPILVDATAIKWNSKRKIESIYGLGGQPRKRGFGNVTYEASITLPYGTQIALRDMSPDGTLMGLGEFDLIISWINDVAANVTSETTTLGGCILAESGMDASQDDTSLTHEFDLHPHRIYNPKVQSNANASWSHELYAGA
ncbi:MAG: hypothetical protein K2G23_05005 [Muribaculaceae bacterium]|nr:hypothetical protein [Muribaculaceae bacterium]